MLLLDERTSRFTIATKLGGKTAEETAGTIMHIFQRLDPASRRSATSDNQPLPKRAASAEAAASAAEAGSSGSRLACAPAQLVAQVGDTAFAKRVLLRQALELVTCFCDAYASWRRDAVENINGRLRRELPRKIHIDKLSDQDLQDIVLMHILTLRKYLGFETPAQALLQQLALDFKISFNLGVALHA